MEHGQQGGHSHGATISPHTQFSSAPPQGGTGGMGIETNLRNPKELPQSNTTQVLADTLKYMVGSPGQFIEVLIHFAAYAAIFITLYSSIWPLIFYHHLDCFWGYMVRATSIMVGWSCLTCCSQKLLLYRYAPYYRIRSCKNVDQVVNMRMRTRQIMPQSWWFTALVALYELYLNTYISKGCTALCCGDTATVPAHYFEMTSKVRRRECLDLCSHHISFCSLQQEVDPFQSKFLRPRWHVLASATSCFSCTIRINWRSNHCKRTCSACAKCAVSMVVDDVKQESTRNCNDKVFGLLQKRLLNCTLWCLLL